MDQSETPFQPPQCIVTNTSGDNEIHDPRGELTDTNDCLEIEDDPDDPDWEIVTPPAEPLPQGVYGPVYFQWFHSLCMFENIISF